MNGSERSDRPGSTDESESPSRQARVAVTGTPGTGKSTATELLAEEYGDELQVIHLNDLITGRDSLWSERDAERDTVVADLEAIADHLGDWTGILDSHLAHHFSVDRVIVLRCHPETLEERLRERGEPVSKATENAESEALDVILSEAVAEHGLGNVYEIDTTTLDPAAVADAIRSVIDGEREPSAGTVDFTEYL